MGDKNKSPSEKVTHHVDIFTVDNTQSEPLFQEYLINGVPLKFQVDTDAAMSIISENQWVKLDSPKLASTEMIPTNYDGSRIQTLGTFTANISRGNKSTTGQFIVVKSHRTYGLLDHDLITNDMSNMENFSVDSEYLPTKKNFVASIELVDKNTHLKFCSAISVPFHLCETLDQELRHLKCQGCGGHISQSRARHQKHSYVRNTSARSKTAATRCAQNTINASGTTAPRRGPTRNTSTRSKAHLKPQRWCFFLELFVTNTCCDFKCNTRLVLSQAASRYNFSVTTC